LVSRYYAIGGFQGIVDKALELKPDGRLKQGLSTISDMLEKGIIEPIELFTRKKEPAGKNIPLKFERSLCRSLGKYK
jgi:hypothetical protein